MKKSQLKLKANNSKKYKIKAIQNYIIYKKKLKLH